MSSESNLFWLKCNTGMIRSFHLRYAHLRYTMAFKSTSSWLIYIVPYYRLHYIRRRQKDSDEMVGNTIPNVSFKRDNEYAARNSYKDLNGNFNIYVGIHCKFLLFDNLLFPLNCYLILFHLTAGFSLTVT